MKSVDEVVALLRERGITPTYQRVQIAQFLFERDQHLSADQVLERVNARDAGVSKATVYNTLGLFADKGLIREVIADPARVFYDSNTQPHHHVFDLDRGTLQDIPASEVSVGTLPSIPEGTVVEGVDVIVRVRRPR